MQDGSITAAKLVAGILLSFESGEAEDGETVVIPGEWQSEPTVFVAGFSVTVADAGVVNVGAENITYDGSNWIFDAIARCETALPVLPGTMRWIAFGYKGSASVEP